MCGEWAGGCGCWVWDVGCWCWVLVLGVGVGCGCWVLGVGVGCWCWVWVLGVGVGCVGCGVKGGMGEDVEVRAEAKAVPQEVMQEPSAGWVRTKSSVTASLITFHRAH